MLRIEENLKEEMYKRGLVVRKVTIGKGYNDITGILNERFAAEEGASPLHGYVGYSDASTQYEVKNMSKSKKR